jgi:hypothetical protein
VILYPERGAHMSQRANTSQEVLAPAPEHYSKNTLGNSSNIIANESIWGQTSNLPEKKYSKFSYRITQIVLTIFF